MRPVSDQATAGEVLSGCLHDPDSLVIILVSAYGDGGAANALSLRDASGGPMFNEVELVQLVNRLIRAGLMQASNRHNSILTPLGRMVLAPANHLA